MKKLFSILVFIAFCSVRILAQDLVGKITDDDTLRTPLFMAVVTQLRDGHALATYKTYFDGTYRIKVKPNETYQLKVSFPGRSDTTVTISVDKHGTLYAGTLFILMHRDGMRLTGFILDRVQDIPIKDAYIILKNVMTRQEDKYETDVNGSYNLKMEYETNYTFRIDKMSPGILNKYEDTSFNISTIGFNKPLDFRLDIKLGPTNGYVAPRPEYDPRAKPINRNLKPQLLVLGVKDTLRRHEQDSIITALNVRMNAKDSAIASLDQQINEIGKKVPLRDEDDTAAVAAAQKAKALEKAEADLKAKQEAEKALQAKLDKEVREAEARRVEQVKLAQARADREQKEKADQLAKAATLNKQQEAARVQAEQDSLLKVAESQNKLLMANRKHVQDSLIAVEGRKIQQKSDAGSVAVLSDKDAAKAKAALELKQKKAQMARQQAEEDSLLSIALTKNKEIMAHRKLVLDSLIAMGQKTHPKEVKKDEKERAKIQISEDSLLKAALARNKEMTAFRKHLLDSLISVESQNSKHKGAANSDQTLVDKQALEQKQKEDADRKEAQLAAQEKFNKEELDRKKMETARKKQEELVVQQRLEKQQEEKLAKEQAQLKKDQAQQEHDMAVAKKEQESADMRAQMQADLAAMKKAREEAEAKVKTERRDKEARDKAAKESKTAASSIDRTHVGRAGTATSSINYDSIKAMRQAEQRTLEAKKAAEEQEKNKLAAELGKVQSNIETPVMNDKSAAESKSSSTDELQTEQDKSISQYQERLRKESANEAAARSSGIVYLTEDGNTINKLIKAKGFIRNGQTDDPLANVSVNIRRLNSIVSQQVVSDASGQYDMLVDSGYFYLVSYYKDKYEISKQILDLTNYKKSEYTMVVQYLKERDDFDPNAKMPVIQFDKNSSKVPADATADMEAIIKMMKNVPDLKIMLYGLASLDEDYPMELSVTRARLVADIMLEAGVKPNRMRINGVGAYRPRSGCTSGRPCTQDQFKLDRVVMYKVVKE